MTNIYFSYSRICLIFLESLDSALHDREVSKLEIESLKEQNEQLLQQYEREKGFHKKYQQVNSN
jgi:hypothetical protein